MEQKSTILKFLRTKKRDFEHDFSFRVFFAFFIVLVRIRLVTTVITIYGYCTSITTCSPVRIW